MNPMDFEFQRERRSEMLREEESRYQARGHRTRSRREARRGFLQLAINWMIGR